MIHFSLLFEADVDPAAAAGLGWSFQGYSFSEFAGFGGFEVMHGFYRIHESYIIEVGVHFEEMFA
jgi:hypothetical protein